MYINEEEIVNHISAKPFHLISEAAEELGVEVYVIGGYVRDIFLNRPSKDIDVVAVGSGIELAKRVAKKIGRGAYLSVFKNFGTAQVKAGDLELEFVGARKESYSHDSRKPVVEDGTLEDDQNRRDFTINALALCLNKERYGELVDPFGGLEDMDELTIRTPLDPDVTFSDDPLRMMRAIRFATQLGFFIDPDTFDAIIRNRERISIISKERIVDELNKIVLSPKPSIGFDLLDKCGLLPLIFPELCALKGELMPVVVSDMENGPKQAHHAMAVVAAMLYARYQAGAMPIAMVSMDNCSHNGEKLRASVMEIVAAWVKNGLVPADFEAYVNDEARVSFPWSMIDKITPRPAEIIEKQLMDAGFEEMQPVITSRNTYIAPFVNAEVPQYLVVEDRFPNGRPALDKAGVYLCDRKTVNDTERMKVTTCLNPLHTALAVYGCLLGYTSIAAEMKDAELVKLVKTIGYKEGLPVVTDPGIISPKAFIDEVVEQRLPNPFIPDTPQRIATDTSQKVGIRFGETIKSYMASDTLNPADLTAIPLALAGWIRYLIGVDDNGAPMNVSSDPMLATLQAALAGVTLGQPDSVDGKLEGILGNASIFGVSLYTAGLADKVTADVKELLAGPGAVRATLKKHLA